MSVGIAADKGYSYTRYPAGASSITGQTSADEFVVSDTRLFYAFAQGFFTGYYPMSATCQMIGDKAYLFTEDAYVNDICASPTDSLILFVAAQGGLFKSTDAGMTWNISTGGLPDADGAYDSFDSTNYNRRAGMLCLFSRAEYGEGSDTVWVGTEYGPFFSTTEGDSFRWRGQGMNEDPDTQDQPTTYDILGHPVNTRTCWAATEDGVYQTVNANRWKIQSNGLPLGEGAIWAAGPAYSLQYDQDDDLLFACTAKGIFYGTPRALYEGNANSEIVTSWKPLGGFVSFTFDSLQSDTVGYLEVEETTSLGFTITPGQNITVVDTVNNLYWATLVDQSTEGLFAIISNENLFYYPDSTAPPLIDYEALEANDTTLVAYGYSQLTGPSILLNRGDVDELTVWLATEDGGLTSYQLSGDIADKYFTDQVTISSSHDEMIIYKAAWREQDSTFFFATDQGLYQAADPHGNWTLLTNYVYNSDGTDSLIVNTRTVGIGPDGFLTTGGYMGGFQRASDGANFTSSNEGLIHRVGAANQLTIFLDEFENSTPAPADSGGIYDVAQEWWGDLPAFDSPDDVDGDPRVVILFLDIDDQYYLDTGDGTFINSYYDGINEYSRLYFQQSNQAEMFYIDTDPGWINRGGAAACNQMFNLINWNQDFDEEYWLKEGMASFTQHVAGYPMATATITFPLMNNLTAWGDFDIDTEHLYSFMLILYLYEQIFVDEDQGAEIVHTIDTVATSPYHGVEGLGRLLYEHDGGMVVDTVDYTPYFASLFDDFILAGALDITDENFYDGKYGFTAVDSRVSATNKNWYWPADTPPPYAFQLPFWSARAFQIKDEPFPFSYFNPDHPIYDVKVNGDDRNQLSYYLLFSDSSAFYPDMPADMVTVVKMETDPYQQKGVEVLDPELQLLGNSDPPNNMRVLTMCTSASGESPAGYVFGDDMDPPDSLYITVAQNPIDDNYMDIYTFSEERLFPDGAQIYRVDALGLEFLEGPEVDIISGTIPTVTLDQEVFYSNIEGSDFVYHITYHLEGMDFATNLQFTAYGEDANGNEISSMGLPVTVDFIESLVGGTLHLSGSNVTLTIPAQALEDDAYVLLSVSQYPEAPIPESSAKLVAAQVDPVHTAVGPLVSAGSAGMDLTAPILLSLPYDPALAENDDLGVYRAEGNGWIYVGGTPGSQQGMLQTYSWKFGQFQVFAGPLGDMKPELPYRFTLDQNYPNPFNPATRIKFELTRAQMVTVDVFNIMGKRVAQIGDGPFEAGRHTLTWNAGSLSSGVYFMRLKAEEGILYRKMMLLK
jgi:hypothetical protein